LDTSEQSIGRSGAETNSLTGTHPFWYAAPANSGGSVVTTKRVPKRNARPRARSSKAAEKRMTTAIVLAPWQLELFRRVAALRAARGVANESTRGVLRPYSVSALIRDLLEKQLPKLQEELKRAGIAPPTGQ
jgi:hypothetical protein